MRAWAGTAITLILLAGCAAAFLNTQRLKLERTPLSAPRVEPKQFSPVCDCPADSATLSLRLRSRGAIDLEVIDAGDRPVRRLVSRRTMPRGPARFEWDGWTDAGRVAPGGRYRFRIGILAKGRSIDLPEATRLDARAPTVSRVDGGPGGVGGGRPFAPYRLSETASLILASGTGGDSTRELRPPGEGRLELSGRRGLRRSVVVRARDRAGNLSTPVRLPVTR